MLEEDEKKKVLKVHRYFGNRSGRMVWELSVKDGKLRNKKKALLEILYKFTVEQKRLLQDLKLECLQQIISMKYLHRILNFWIRLPGVYKVPIY